MAGPSPLPHRVSFLAPLLTMPNGAPHLEQPAALLLFIAFFQHLVRHPRVTVVDPDDHRLTDREDRLLTIQHPGIDDFRGEQFGEWRRDELVWLELSLDPARPMPVKLKAERYDGRTREFVAIGQAPLGGQIENVIGQWLAATELTPNARRMEPFGADDLLRASAAGYEAIRTRGQDGSVRFDLPPRLQVPFFRFIYVTCERYTFEEILRLEPDDPWSLRDQFLAQLHQDPPRRDLSLIKRALSVAPNFGKLHLSMFGEGVSDEEKLNAFAAASVLIPGNSFALKDYGYTLDYAGRWSEALRWAERACRATPRMIPAHMLAMEVYDLCRPGEALRCCSHHQGFLDHLVERGAIDPNDVELRHTRLRLSDALMRAGRLDEAIAMRARFLEGLEGLWPNQSKVLQTWRSDPATFAQLYAREAAMRGDPGRVVEGFAAAAPDGALELSMFIDALIALGREEDAALAYAQHARTNQVINPVARLAGARALALVGDTAGAIECVQRVQLGFAHTGWDGAVERVLRVLGTRPLAEWEAVVQAHFENGARTMARLVARDAADFVPGASQSGVIHHALTGATPYGHDDSLFGALRASLEPYGLRELDQLFATYAQPTLEHADRLVDAFPGLIPPEPGEGAPEGAERARAAMTLWAFAASFGRYLALTTQPANVLAGGYRQVVTTALALLETARGVLPRLVVRQLFEGLERVAGIVDPWLLDAWLLRFERALDLEANEGGHLEPLTSGLPWISWLLRGDEQIGWEFKLAQEAASDPARAKEAMLLFERCVRAFGRSAAPKWSTAAAAALPPEQAVDVHLTATFANQGFAGPALAAARVLMPHGRGRAAFDALCSNLPGAGKQWREQQVATLAPLWAQAQMPCPHDWNQAAQKGMEALQQGNFQLAVDCHRWCLAIDPNNAQLWRNLGIAYARLGDARAAIGAFARVDRIEAPKYAGQALREAEHGEKAVEMYRYASTWFTNADEWLALAGTAASADDADAAAEAYGRAIERNPNAGTPNALHQWADALNETGQYQKGAEVAQHLLQIAANDPTYSTCGAYHLGNALLGLRRFQEAIPYAERAIAQNKYPDNRAPYQEVLDRARRGEPKPPKPSRSATSDAMMYAALARGDFKAILDGVAAMPEPKPWRVRRAGLDAAQFRFESENDVIVTPRAREAATSALAATAGRTETDAAFVRLLALRVRENDGWPVDPPAKLGARVPREQFARLFDQRRGGGAAGPADPNDVVVFPGQRVGRLSDYVRLMKAMKSGGVNQALQAFGLDMASYGQVSVAWGQRIAADPALAQKYAQMIRG